MPRPKGSKNKKNKISKIEIKATQHKDKSITEFFENKEEVQLEKVKNKRQCTCCGDHFNLNDFYISFAPQNKYFGRLNTCKSCIDDIYAELVRINDSYKKALYRLCQIFDMPFIHTLYEASEKQATKQHAGINRIYFQKINSIGDTNGKAGIFSASDKWLDDGNIVIGQTTEQIYCPTEIDESFEVTKEMMYFWGVGLDKQDYYLLETEYQDWCLRYEVDSKSMEMLVKQICLQNFDINKRRAKGEKVDTQLKTLQDLLASSNIKPVQEMAQGDRTISTWGEWVRKIEEQEPIPEATEEFKDPDGIRKYIDIWFVKHFARIFGLLTENDDIESDLIDAKNNLSSIKDGYE
jgi:hypothetical protein